ncbi:MAG TPA: citrate/2-methylcitrate synthase, partial [Dehalococcoidia bacterium]|nr:citrate/2-methylcitrate synthase [Dehalococcoidia bacterium]
LLLYGELPTRPQLAELESELISARAVPGSIMDVIRLVGGAHPMDVLRTAVSALSAVDPEAGDHSPEATRRKGTRLTAQVPSIITAHHAIRNDRDLVEPSKDLGHAANFLYTLTGETPTDEAASLMDKDLILHAEHGSNASAFTARVVTGTRADVHSAITAAIAALSGPLHGGAAENVMKMARAIEEPARAADYVKEVRARGEPIMGFGHRVYRTEDPRARHLREGVRRLSQEKGEPKWYGILDAVVEAMRPLGRRGINVNVDFYSGATYYLHGIPLDLFVPIFAVGRIPGWIAQVMEQQEANILIRPRLQYVGPLDSAYVPIDER